MGFLSPLFLLAAAAVAVPLLLHMALRRRARRQPFPALRYLRKTEREHASRIRLRQLLLLVLRILAVLLLVLAGARLFLRGAGEEHEPTAVAIVLDNSLSTGLVVGEERLLDDLKRRALESVDRSTPEDRVWVVRAGEPWDVPVPSSPAALRRRIRETEASGAAVSLARAVAEARALVAGAGLPGAEVHLVTDLQASAVDSVDGPGPGGTDLPPVILYASPGEPPPNRWIAGVEVAGGLSPLADQRTEIAVRVEGSGPAGEASTDTVRVRLILADRVTAAVDAPVGSTVLLPAGPFPPGALQGTAELDPDALRADDRRHLAVRVRPPPRVVATGDPGFFVEQALAVLRDAGRIREGGIGDADLRVAPRGEGLGDGEGPAAVILPPGDPALLPALNRRLAAARIPWRLEQDPLGGETTLRVLDLPVPLEGVTVRRAYRLRAEGGGDRSVVRARRTTGEPWLVTGRGGGAPYLLVASPLDPEATSIPVRPEMLPLVEWMVSGWSPGGPGQREVAAGSPLPLPPGATSVRDPGGTLHSVDGTHPFEMTGIPGIYAIRRGDSVLSRIAVNPPAGESRLARTDPASLLRRVGPPLHTVTDPTDWPARVYLRRRGRELWRPLVVAALVLLVVEGLVAATGAGRGERKERAGSG